MATTFYCRNLNIGVEGYKLLALERGAASQTLSINTVASSTYEFGSYWVTKPLRGFTLSGNVSMRVRARESNNLANSKIRLIVYRWRPGVGLSSALLTVDQGAELTTTDSTVDLSGTPTSTVFNDGDCLVFETSITNQGTMGNGRVVEITYDGATASAAGDSWIQITENVTYNKRVFIVN